MALLAQFRVVSCEQIKYLNIRLQTWLQLQGQWRLTRLWVCPMPGAGRTNAEGLCHGLWLLQDGPILGTGEGNDAVESCTGQIQAFTPL